MNNGTWIVNLGKDPEALKVGEKDLYKLRCAEKAPGKKSITRWFNALVGGPDVDTASRLGKGDTIALAGQMSRVEWAPKKPRYHGEMVGEDEMPFAKILQVIKSPSFFGAQDAPPEEQGPPPGETTSATPDLTGTPLEGL